MFIIPVDLACANAFVAQHHRHHGKVVGHKFSIAVADMAHRIRGVAIVGRPVSRILDDGWTLEVLRCCTDGERNVASMLYRAAWRAARAMGYCRLVTYTLATEKGSSLRGACFRLVGKAGGGSWNRRERPRFDRHPLQEKLRWEVTTNQFPRVGGDTNAIPSQPSGEGDGAGDSNPNRDESAHTKGKE